MPEPCQDDTNRDMRVASILETCLYVDDLDAAQQFYTNVLGLELVDRRPPRHVFLRCAQQMLLLFDPRQSSQPDSDVPPHGPQGASHVAFAVPADELEQWSAHLQALEVTIETTVDWPGGGRSIYFRDPAGNSVELAPATIWG